MQMLFRLFANLLWFVSTVPETLAFHNSTYNVNKEQKQILYNIIKRNSKSRFGLKYDFAKIQTVEEFQKRVPISYYDDYDDFIEEVGNGMENCLTCDPVILLEPTSGSTAATKLIPYTASLKKDFQKGIAPWIFDLYKNDFSLMSGQAYWSVSPITSYKSFVQNKAPKSKIPIGFEDDSEYLGKLEKKLFNYILAVPPEVRFIEEIDSFRYVTLLFLLRSRSLSLISVWNPTFLIFLFEKLYDWHKRLAEDIANGTISPPTPITKEIYNKLIKSNKPDLKRAGEIIAAFNKTCTKKLDDWQGRAHASLWPDLKIISLWADAHAARFIPKVRKLFPQAKIQEKGLIATEGFVSFPLMKQEGSLLAIRSHFFEFLPINDGSIKLAHELKKGGTYSVIITTSGGLYRYRLYDLVEIKGFLRGCPIIRFMGKENLISDYFGEKLNEQHVQKTLDPLFKKYNISPSFAMLACELNLSPPSYVLFVQVEEEISERVIELVSELETRLRENYHYDYCRRLGQLGHIHIFRIFSKADESYILRCQAIGQKIGEIKQTLLHPVNGWSNNFSGKFI